LGTVFFTLRSEEPPAVLVGVLPLQLMMSTEPIKVPRIASLDFMPQISRQRPSLP